MTILLSLAFNYFNLILYFHSRRCISFFENKRNISFFSILFDKLVVLISMQSDGTLTLLKIKIKVMPVNLSRYENNRTSIEVLEF